MKLFKNKLSIIIPTKDRPEILRRLLGSLEIQSQMPDEVLIVDGSEQAQPDIVEDYPGIPLRYLCVNPPGLIKQRKTGIENSGKGMNLIGYLDDDVVLEKDCVLMMMKFWEGQDASVGGAGFNIVNVPYPLDNWITRLFFMSSPNGLGRVLKSGMNTSLCPTKDNYFSEWLCGGATVWRKEVFDEFQFDDWYQGGVMNDDLDFSYNVRKKYKLVVVAHAKLEHLELPRKKLFDHGLKTALNQFYFVRKHRELSKICLAWWCIGNALHFFKKGLQTRKKDCFMASLGYLAGMCKGVLNRLDWKITYVK